MVNELLQVQNLRVEIRTRESVVRPVDDVSFTVHEGETVGLVGESGSGKTMTGMSLLRLLPGGGRIANGSVLLDGTNLVELSDDRMRGIRGNEIAVIFQDPMTSLNPTMTVGRQVGESLVIHRGWSAAAARARALDLLNLVGVPLPRERLDSFPHQLSGGLRQRVVIAMALACEPKLLIADEPTTALDVTIQKQILCLLDRLTTELGMGMLLITHDMGVIAGHANRVLVMYAGRIIESAPTPDLFARKRHRYTEALLDSIPSVEADYHRHLYSIPGIPPSLIDHPVRCRFAPRCRYATDECWHDEPSLTSDSQAHEYACFHPVPTERLSATSRVADPRGTLVPDVRIPDARAERTPGEKLLVVEDLVKEYPVGARSLGRNKSTVKAVSGVSFSLNRGASFGLVGESGCGKTTLGRLLVALERSDAGRILFEDQDVGSLRGRALTRSRRRFQLMFQDPYASLDPRMRVGAILKEFLAIQGMMSRSERNAEIRALLGEVGLPREAVDLYPHEFSGGQRQRLGLARALTLRPSLIVADEPVSALDVSIRSQILNLMQRLQHEYQLTYVVISHDLSVIRYTCDRLGVMYLGKLVEIGSIHDIFNAPAHHYTSALLSSIPTIDPVLERAKVNRVTEGELPSAIEPPSGCRFRTRCPAAQDVCAELEPSMADYGGRGHYAACHFPLIPTKHDASEATASAQ